VDIYMGAMKVMNCLYFFRLSVRLITGT